MYRRLKENQKVWQRLITHAAMLKTDVELTIAGVLASKAELVSRATVSGGYRYTGSETV